MVGRMNSPFVLPPDYHSHTSLCKHAEGRAIDYARAARERGLKEMACTEHSPAPEPFSPEVRMALDEFPTYREWVREANELDGITVLLGIEADYYNGCEGFLEQWLPEQEFDYVLGSVHFNRYDRDNNHALTGVYDHNDPERSWTEYFRNVQLLADTGLYDVVAHLDLPKKFGRLPAPDLMESLVKPTLDRIARAEMGIEINTIH
jgi:histidinol-phosphatase (PHP family)